MSAPGKTRTCDPRLSGLARKFFDDSDSRIRACAQANPLARCVAYLRKGPLRRPGGHLSVHGRYRSDATRMRYDAQALKSGIWQLLFGLETVKQGLEHRGEVVAAAGNGGKREHHLHYLLDGEIVSHLLRVLSGRE